MKIPPVKALIFMKWESVRLPGKNIKPLCGKPLCYWILNVLNRSKYIVETIINTDSEKIAQLTKQYFPVTIHMRPDHLLNIGGGDEAYPIMAYDLELTEGEFFVNVHSTTPLIAPETLDKAIEIFNKAAFNLEVMLGGTFILKNLIWQQNLSIIIIAILIGCFASFFAAQQSIKKLEIFK